MSKADDERLDVLMSVLCTLHELGVITDPAVSAELTPEGKAVTVEFLLDFARVSQDPTP